MAKVINPNAISDMALVNAKTQAKMTQLIQKLGRGKRRVKVTLSKGTRAYLSKMVEELRKQMAIYEKQMPNLFQFFNYLEKEAKVTKENKKIKEKDISLSYEELDFLKLNIRETISGIDRMRESLKWYNIIKKGVYKTLKKQNELVLEEFKNTSVSK